MFGIFFLNERYFSHKHFLKCRARIFAFDILCDNLCLFFITKNLLFLLLFLRYFTISGHSDLTRSKERPTKHFNDFDKVMKNIIKF